MKRWILPAAAAAAALMGGAAMAQPYGDYGGGYYGGGYYNRPAYNDSDNYGRGYRGGYARDSDRDGIPDRAEWGRDRDHDGRPDQWDRYDNRRDWGHRRYRYEGYSRGYHSAPYYGYGYRY
jgi:hypothetical protein